MLNRRISTVVLEDDFLQWQGWHRVLECIPKLQVVAIVQTPEQAKIKCKECPPDLLIIDGHVRNDMRVGAQLALQIRQWLPNCRILGVSFYRQALEFLKPVCDHIMSKATLWDQPSFEQHLELALLGKERFHQTRLELAQPLTSEEHQVLKMMAQDKTISEIAKSRGQTDRQVKKARKSLYDKMGVNTDHGAVAVGFATGLLSPQDIECS